MKREIDINAVIALSSVIDEFDVLFFDLNNLLSKYKDSEAALFKLDEIARNKCFLKKRKLVHFYNKYNEIIKNITSIINFRYFIICINNYDKRMFNELLDYLKANRKYKDKILESLNILKKLGYNFIYFNFDNDYNEYLYSINPEILYEGIDDDIKNKKANERNGNTQNNLDDNLKYLYLYGINYYMEDENSKCDNFSKMKILK